MKLKSGIYTTHKAHLVQRSILPFFTAMSLAVTVLLIVLRLWNYLETWSLFYIMLTLTIVIVFEWLQVVTRESNYFHTSQVRASIKLGFLLFLVSEVMLFVSFFWAFFHSALAPSIAIGAIWPPYMFPTIDPFFLPLLNTALLVGSSLTIHAANNAYRSTEFKSAPLQPKPKMFINEFVNNEYSKLVTSNRFSSNAPIAQQDDTISTNIYDKILIKCIEIAIKILFWQYVLTKGQGMKYFGNCFYFYQRQWKSYIGLPYLIIYKYYHKEERNYLLKNTFFSTVLWYVITIMLGLVFLQIQFIEYVTAPFGITDGIYASVFYMLTGLHGLHVIFGTLFLMVVGHRLAKKNSREKRELKKNDQSVKFSMWYWHFVDIIWVFLYLTLYIGF